MENLTLWIGGGSTAIALWVLKKYLMTKFIH